MMTCSKLLYEYALGIGGVIFSRVSEIYSGRIVWTVTLRFLSFLLTPVGKKRSVIEYRAAGSFIFEIDLLQKLRKVIKRVGKT